MVVVASFALLPVGPAATQTYPGCAVELSDVSVDPGDTISVNGTNAAPGEDVVASMRGQVIGRGAADGNGDFSFPATVPADVAAGTYSVEVSCGPQGPLLHVTVTVGPVAAATGRLPKTGSGGTIPLSSIAIGLIAVGGLVALTSRRRTTPRRDRVSTPVP